MNKTLVFLLISVMLFCFGGSDSRLQGYSTQVTYVLLPMDLVTGDVLDKTIDTKWENLWVSTDCMAVMILKADYAKEFSKYHISCDTVKGELVFLPEWNTRKPYYQCYHYDSYSFNTAYQKAKTRGLPLFLWQDNLYTTE